MAAFHKLFVDEFYDDTYILIALHCSLDNYRLAYLLNKQLDINLRRLDKDLDLNYSASSYAVYQWTNVNTHATWHLISNYCKTEERMPSSKNTLFENHTQINRTYYLLPEFKNVNYFIKISDEIKHIHTKIVLNKLQTIPHIITSYSVDLSQLKSKDHLIF